MARFQKDREKLGFRTPEHFRSKFPVPKIPIRVQKACLAGRRVRYTQHKG
ncbi:MAG: hypothetical protein ACOZBZ_03505 [Patescibacteria group bacterium]